MKLLVIDGTHQRLDKRFVLRHAAAVTLLLLVQLSRCQIHLHNKSFHSHNVRLMPVGKAAQRGSLSAHRGFSVRL